MSEDRMKHGSDWNGQELPDELQSLMSAYRQSLPDPEPSANFMPALWTKIESRRSLTYSFGRFARGLVTAAVAACLVMSAMLVVPKSYTTTAVSSAYVDVLDEHNGNDDVADLDLTRGEQL